MDKALITILKIDGSIPISIIVEREKKIIIPFNSTGIKDNSEQSSGGMQGGLQSSLSYQISGWKPSSLEDGRAVGRHLLNRTRPICDTRGLNGFWNGEVSLGSERAEVSGQSTVDRSIKLLLETASGRELPYGANQETMTQFLLNGACICWGFTCCAVSAFVPYPLWILPSF